MDVVIWFSDEVFLHVGGGAILTSPAQPEKERGSVFWTNCSYLSKSHQRTMIRTVKATTSSTTTNTPTTMPAVLPDLLLRDSPLSGGFVTEGSGTEVVETPGSPGARHLVRHGHRDGFSPQAGTTLRFSLNSGATTNEQQTLH